MLGATASITSIVASCETPKLSR
ncbi:MAG: Vmc-like lipoprotein signal peptide domain-containing protein [Flavobacteriales bacterium]